MADPLPNSNDDEGPELDPTGQPAPAEPAGDDTDADEAAEEEFTPPTREEWTRTQSALKKANEEAKKHRLKVKELTAPKDGEPDAVAKAVEEATSRYKPAAVRSAAKAAFLEAGLNDASSERVRKLLRLVDMDDVDVDDDGDVVGLADQIDGIKADYPELFRKADAPSRKRAPKLDAAGRDSGAPASPKSTGEKIAAQVLGQR